MGNNKKITVTKTFLPPKEDYDLLLDKVWDNQWVTNHGPLVTEFENKLKEYLDVKHLFFVTNGTIALQIAIKALELKGEIITTPFSYVATTSSIVWEGAKPVFADINKKNFNIDSTKIESKITKDTSGIIATHVFGNPCDVEHILEIADKNNLKTIFDAAHSFDVKFKNNSILNYGDISTLSFHATKIFHSVEGGAIITNNDDLAEKISYLRNFGHNGEEEFHGLGINGKNSELHAAMGLCNLEHIAKIIVDRKRISNIYKENLDETNISFQEINNSTEYNYSYFPVVLKSEKQLETVMLYLNKENIFPRRYFYPSLNKLPYLEKSILVNSEFVSKRILCLPSYYKLSEEIIIKICKIINTQL
jgi:dTDP-4-amino-4,6-dideoxygalactose transaminase